jgi:hypothetical protein
MDKETIRIIADVLITLWFSILIFGLERKIDKIENKLKDKE